MSLPEPWLRGPIAGIAVELQPVAHTLLAVREEVDMVGGRVAAGDAWTSVADGWSVGQHLRHLAGSTQRLLAYATGRALTADELARVESERGVPEAAPSLAQLCAELRDAIAQVEGVLHRLSEVPAAIHQPREVGRARLPTTTFGLLFHIAEHAQRHMAQVAVLARVLGERRGLEETG